MAAKSSVGTEANPISTEGKPQWFDTGAADSIVTCLSCHPGGAAREGIVQPDGTVIPYDSPEISSPVHSYDRDFYNYTAMDIVAASLADSIAEAVAAAGDPKRHDWNKSGVVEADCMLCHIDPESPQALTGADGLKVFPNRPRLMIFAERNQAGEVVKISLGTPLANGLMNETALSYTNDLQRMSRPTSKLALMQLPAQNVGEMMDMWTKGLEDIDAQNEKDGTMKLPFALYGSNVPKIWDTNGMIKAEYCANPNGPGDEMARLQANASALNQLFEGFLQYMFDHNLMTPSGDHDQDMAAMMGMFFNDFIYAYNVKSPMDTSGNTFMPIPLPLRAYDQGRFYTDWDSANASVRDYVRSPLIEGEGVEYVGRVGLTWNATMYGMGLAMQGDDTYMDRRTGEIKTNEVLNDLNDGVIPADDIKGVLHDFLPSFFSTMATAELMGLDLNHNGSPIAYVQLVKDQHGEWTAKTYWEVDEVTYKSIHQHLFGSSRDANDPRWIKVCGQCHVMTHDNGSGIDLVRLYNVGMKADFVKNGAFINNTDDPDASGYDVHMSSSDNSKMGCGSCHLKQSGLHLTRDLEDVHNFLKGTDTAHMVRNELDNNCRPKTCERCHLTNLDAGSDPTEAHEARFGHHTAEHIENIACQTCHIPFKKTWRFRAFDDTLGYYGNFDNRMGYNVLDVRDFSQKPFPTMKIMAFPGPYAIDISYGTAPGYGIPHFNMVAQHIEADPANDVVAIDYVSEMVDYFRMTRDGDPGLVVNGMPTNPQFDFWKYFYQMFLKMKTIEGIPVAFDPDTDNEVLPPLYWANGQNGYPQIVTGNPITILTWVDANPADGEGDMEELAYGGAKILFLRELNAVVDEYRAPTQLGLGLFPIYLNQIGPNDSSYLDDPRVGKVIIKDSGYVIYDHTGDMYPDLWYVEDVRAVQEALVTVLKAEGVVDPKPMLFMAAHYFSDTHGVQPKEYSLGAVSCNDCHNNIDDATGQEVEELQPGAHRTTDRIINFLPWQPPWFEEANRALEYNHETGEMEPTGEIGSDGKGAFFIVDGEIAYVKGFGKRGQEPANNMKIIGAKAHDLLHLSKHHAEELFYLAGEDTVMGSMLPGVSQNQLTDEEKEEIYVHQIANGPANLNGDVPVAMFIPEHLKPAITEMGIVQFPQHIELHAGSYNYVGKAHVVRVGLHHDSEEAMFISMPVLDRPEEFHGYGPMLVKQDDEHSPWNRVDGGGVLASATVVGRSPGYMMVRIRGAHGGSGRYAAVWATSEIPEPDTVVINGLEWQQSDDGQTRPYNALKRGVDTAVSYCDSLVLNNKAGWRVPTLAELESIVDTNNNPTIVTGLAAWDGPYWSSDRRRFSTDMMGVDFSDGTTNNYKNGMFRKDELYVRCVHD